MIHLTGISKNYGTQVLYKDGNFQVKPGDRVGLVGPNGAGKTTIFRIIMGEESVSSGSVSVADRTVIGYFSQSVGEMAGRSVLEEVKAGAGRVAALAREIAGYEERLARMDPSHPEHEAMDDEAMAALLEKYGEAQAEFEQRSGYDLDSRAQAILTGLGFPPEEHGRPVETYSGGWKMRVALAKILVLSPDVLLMDEPTNHLDLESILWLERWLSTFKGALVMTSHDHEFLNRNVKRIVEIANRALTSYTGDYEFYLRERGIRREQLLAAHRKQQDMLAKEEEFIARFAARASHAAQVQSRVKKLEKIDRIEIPPDVKSMRFEFPPSPRSGNDVAKLAGLGMTYRTPGQKEKNVFHGASAMIQRLEKIALVGVNGAGKSTLLKILAGELDASEGECVIGSNVKTGYFSQHSLEVLNAGKTVFEEIHDRIPEATIGYVRNLLGSFLFSGDEVEKKVGSLSGGEKSRVVLATILAKPVNFLVLDEPTNHLDIQSREVLLDAIQRFDGTVIIVSHDRHFLKGVASKTYELDRGELRVYPGTYDEYLERHARDLPS